MRNYTVAVMAEYNVSTDKDIFEAEDAAVEEIKNAVNGTADEVEAEVVVDGFFCHINCLSATSALSIKYCLFTGFNV